MFAFFCFDKCSCHPSFPHGDDKDRVTGRDAVNVQEVKPTHTKEKQKQIHKLLMSCSKYFDDAVFDSDN